jgi:hypothetical protein
MDENGKLILTDLQDNIKTINKNIIYLCQRTAADAERLKNIENIVINNDARLNICEDKIITMRTWGTVIASIIILIVLPLIAIYG